MPLLRRALVCLAVVASIALIGCGSSGSNPSAATIPSPTPKPAPNATRYVSAMTPALQAVVKQQSWFTSLTDDGVRLAKAIQECEREAIRKGEEASVAAMLSDAAEQAWYQDGLEGDELLGLAGDELLGLAGVFDAYNRSLNDRNAPPIGRALKSTIQHRLFEVMSLPETGEMVVLASAADPRDGHRILEMSRDALPKVEAIVGAYPYHVLHIEVTELPPGYLGLSYNEFIELDTGSVDAPTLVHEITHSTLYGIFPIWFEEGAAHFLEAYFTVGIPAAASEHNENLRFFRRDSKLDMRVVHTNTLADEMAQRAQGFFFLNSLYDVRGIDGVSEMIRSVRKKSYTSIGQDLLDALANQGTPEEQASVAKVICDRVVGARHDYCTPGR